MVKPPDQSVAEESAADPAATRESQDFRRLDLIEAAKSDVAIAFHKTLAWLVPIGLIVAFSMLTAGLAVWLLQFFLETPWLSEVRRHELQTVLFSGAIGAVVSRGFKAYLT